MFHVESVAHFQHNCLPKNLQQGEILTHSLIVYSVLIESNKELIRRLDNLTFSLYTEEKARVSSYVIAE